MSGHAFPFAFAFPYRVAALPFGVTPGTSRVVVEDDGLRVEFGPWRLRTPMSNIEGVEITGPYSLVKTAGPAHLSFADRGLTFATNGRRGVCVRFQEPVPGIEPTGRLRHPAVTLTVADVDGLATLLRRRGLAAA
jgi:hypothetical protein